MFLGAPHVQFSTLNEESSNVVHEILDKHIPFDYFIDWSCWVTKLNTYLSNEYLLGPVVVTRVRLLKDSGIYTMTFSRRSMTRIVRLHYENSNDRRTVAYSKCDQVSLWLRFDIRFARLRTYTKIEVDRYL